MRLAIITGFRDYLLPNELEPAVLADGLRAIDPATAVARVRWHAEAATGPVSPTCYATFATDDTRARLLLEFIQDSVPAHATAFVVMPTGIDDQRLRALIDLAQATLGDAAVRARRLSLSDRTQAVLERLRAAAGEPAPTTPALPAIAVATTTLDGVYATGDGLDTLRAAMQRNYTHAVLTLGARLVARESVFDSADRTAAIVRMLDHNQMTIRADLDDERVLAELRPGGELYGLLTRPLPPEPQPIALAELEVAKVVARS